MSILYWPTAPPRGSSALATARVPGAYAGLARFQPRDVKKLPDPLAQSAGSIVELGFAGIAPLDEPFAGQALYLEWRKDSLLHGFLVPEQDLEFLNEAPAARRR